MEPVSAGPVTRRRLSFLTADVFTRTPLTGNPLAIFPEAKGLSPAEMQAVAREMNLSETVFVFPPENPAHSCRLRIFTPGGELPFAGHPTLGAAHVLAATRRVPVESARGDILDLVFEEAVGPVAVRVTLRDQFPIRTELLSARLPEPGPPAPAIDLLARVLSLHSEEIADGADRPEAWSCGVPFLFVPLRSEEALRRARLDVSAWQAHLASFWASHVYPFAYGEPPGLIHGRMFAPEMGIVEDPATGAAAAAFAGYLDRRRPSGMGPVLRTTIRQGVAMGRPSTLFLEAESGPDGRLRAVRVAGESVLVSEGTFWV
jgi:trans-2,3-dihydro-3-hydroxyanthranilate isomerase